MGEKSGPNPTDRAKRGVKRRLWTEAQGLPIGWAIAGANRHDSQRVRATLESVPIRRPKPTRKKPQHLFLDKAYVGDSVQEVVQEFGYTREIEDRVMAPLPVWGVAAEKIGAGAVQALIAGLVVFPLALFIPATPVHLHVHWLFLLTIAPLGAILSAAFGLTMGTRIKPQQVPLLFAIVVLPITFLGAVYYPWAALEPIRWLQILVLINPLVYMSEGFRLSLTTGVPHMSVWAIYTALIGFTVALTWVGIDGFRRRVLS